MNRKNVISIVITLLFMSALIFIVFRWSQKENTLVRSGYYFNTYITITGYYTKDEKAIAECLSLCDKYEKLFSRTIKGSDIYNINSSNGEVITVDPETYYLLSKAIEICEETNGAIDITVADLMDLWGFNSSESINSLPNESDIQELLTHVDYRNIILLEDNKVMLKDPESHIDLGFIAKGYIADKLKEHLLASGVDKAIISLGGNIYVIGQKDENTDFAIGVKDPSKKTDILTKLYVHDTSVVTSGTYERYIEVDGQKYHHILDTKTGYPVNNGIEGVTIICESSMYADALSTTCLILGEENSKDLLNKYNAEAMFY